MAVGEDWAAARGVSVRRLLLAGFIAGSVLTAPVTAITGPIGFVGLIVPHATRRLVGSDLRVVLPVCLLGGAAVLVASDLVARASFAWFGSEPPVGAVTAILGGPLALVLLRRSAPTRQLNF
jgi:iron complex transport system permease protein